VADTAQLYYVPSKSRQVVHDTDAERSRPDKSTEARCLYFRRVATECCDSALLMVGKNLSLAGFRSGEDGWTNHMELRGVGSR
jgi:hypothetical protein